MVFGSMFDFLITKGYTSKFTQQSLDWLPESTTDSTLSMTVVGSSSQKVTNITVKAIGAAASFAVTTTTYTSKTYMKYTLIHFNISGILRHLYASFDIKN